MKKLFLLVTAVGFSSPALAQGVPNKAFYVGLGGSVSATHYSDQSITAIGVSNASNTTTGAHMASGSAGGPPINLGLDSDTSIPPVVQLGYFERIMDTRWLWGAKASYSYVNSKSTSNAFLIPQYGSLWNDSFHRQRRREIVPGRCRSPDRVRPVCPDIRLSRSYVYVGAGPTMSRVKTRIDDLIGFADINGTRTDVSGTAQTFTSSGWVLGGAVTIGTTYLSRQLLVPGFQLHIRRDP